VLEFLKDIKDTSFPLLKFRKQGYSSKWLRSC